MFVARDPGNCRDRRNIHGGSGVNRKKNKKILEGRKDIMWVIKQQTFQDPFCLSRDPSWIGY